MDTPTGTLGNWVRHVPGPGLVHIQIVWNELESAYVLEAVGSDTIQTFAVFGDRESAQQVADLFTHIERDNPDTSVNTELDRGHLWYLHEDGGTTVLWITENPEDDERLWLNLGSREWTTAKARFTSDDHAMTFVPFIDALVLMHDPTPGVQFLYRWPMGSRDFRTASASMSIAHYDDPDGEYWNLLHLSRGHATTVGQFRNLDAARAAASAIDEWWRAPVRMILGTEDLTVLASDHPGIEWMALRSLPSSDTTPDVIARLWASPSTDGSIIGLLCPTCSEPSPLAVFRTHDTAKTFSSFMNGIAGYEGRSEEDGAGAPT